MIKIIGTSHISPESIEEIKKSFESFEPDIVAVELDWKRLRGLKSEEKHSSFTSPTTALISTIQNYLSRKTGIAPGSEMLTAVDNAQNNGIPISLIDQPIEQTVNKIKEVSGLEKLKMFGYGLMGLLGFGSSELSLTEVPDSEVLEDILKRFEIIFPEFYNVLIEERNNVMAEKIEKLDSFYGKVLVVVGAGHKSGIENLLKDKGVELT